MSITIKLEFPAGRYHATPWGRHVNEGVPEWPPSPWRLLRALVAVWRRTCPELTEASVRRALEPLLEAPDFQLPDHRVAHTRHYMPWEKKNPGDRTLVFDTFVVLSKGATAHVHWANAELASSDRATLTRLLDNLTTLGRAEGWIEASLADSPASLNCRCSTGELNPVPVFCPDPTTAFDSEYYPHFDAKALKKGLKPGDLLFDCPRWHLCLDTQVIHAARWPSVPGAKWVNYSRPSEFVAKTKRRDSRTPTIARFILDGPVLPLVTDTIRVADAFRNAAMNRFRHWCQDHPAEADQFRRNDDPATFASPALSGKDSNGTILSGDSHALFLPTSTGYPYITHIDVFCRRGIDRAELESLGTLRKLRAADSLQLRVALVGTGTEKVFGGDLHGHSDVWVSATPFLGPDHVGVKGVDRYMRKALRSQWRKLALQVPAYQDVQISDIVELSIDDPAWKGRPKPSEYRRVRSKHRYSGYRPCAIYKLVFTKPIPGPLCIGYGSHFGMGMFRPLIKS